MRQSSFHDGRRPSVTSASIPYTWAIPRMLMPRYASEAFVAENQVCKCSDARSCTPVAQTGVPRRAVSITASLTGLSRRCMTRNDVSVCVRSADPVRCHSSCVVALRRSHPTFISKGFDMCCAVSCATAPVTQVKHLRWRVKQSTNVAGALRLT